MHELSIVFYVIDEVEALVEEQSLPNVSSVTLEIGEVSGIVPMFLQDCWPWAIKKTKYLKESRLLVETLPAVTICNSCGKTYGTIEHGKTCPHCQSPETVLLKGQEVNIKQIEVFEGEESPEAEQESKPAQGG